MNSHTWHPFFGLSHPPIWAKDICSRLPRNNRIIVAPSRPGPGGQRRPGSCDRSPVLPSLSMPDTAQTRLQDKTNRKTCDLSERPTQLFLLCFNRQPFPKKNLLWKICFSCSCSSLRVLGLWACDTTSGFQKSFKKIYIYVLMLCACVHVCMCDVSAVLVIMGSCELLNVGTGK